MASKKITVIPAKTRPDTIIGSAEVLPKKRVAAYARVSSGKEAMLHSLATQINYYQQMIENHQGWTFCGVFADEAVTGTKDSRENFQKLLEKCRRKEGRSAL